MAKLKVEIGKDNPILRAHSEKVSSPAMKTPRLQLSFDALVKGMKTILDDEKGLGLAAPQVGENLRVILCKMDSGTDQEMLFVMVNPEILEMSASKEDLERFIEDARIDCPEGVEIAEEGCLSLPGYYVNVARARSIVVKFRDGRKFLKGKMRRSKIGDLDELVLKFNGLNARVVQHEVDHLDGVLICDKPIPA